MTSAEAVEIALGAQLAILDNRQADLNILLADLDAPALRQVIRELLILWGLGVIMLPAGRRGMREAVAADALAQAAMGDGR